MFYRSADISRYMKLNSNLLYGLYIGVAMAFTALATVTTRAMARCRICAATLPMRTAMLNVMLMLSLPTKAHALFRLLPWALGG